MADPRGIGPVDDFGGSARLRALMRYWTDKRADRSMPSQGQIDPIEIPHLLPIVLLADATPAGARMRLLGSEATAAYGQEMRGWLVHDIQFGEFSVLWLEAFVRVIQSAVPAFATGLYLRGTERCAVSTVLMPLAGDDSSVSRIFGGLLIRPIARQSITERQRTAGYVVPIAGGSANEFGSSCADSRRI